MLYKYLPQQFVGSFLDGRVLCRSLAAFQAIEADAARGDMHEGVALFRPEELVGNKPDGSVAFRGVDFVSCIRKPNEVFVFCVSEQESVEMERDFGTPIVIEDVKQFLKRFRKAVRALRGSRKAFLRSLETFHGSVSYYDLGESPVWRVPQRQILRKLKRFEYQHEHRFVFGQRQNFYFGETDEFATINGPWTPASRESDQEFLELGDLRDITTTRDARTGIF